MGARMFRKGLAVAVILLFIGVAFAIPINANVSKASVDSELVEFTTEVCGLKGGKQAVQLTKEEAEEVDRLFENVQQRLNESTSRKEAEEIFKEAIVELDKYELLGGLSVKQAQRLVRGKCWIPEVQKIIDRIYNRFLGRFNNYDNSNCLIFGRVTNADYFNYWLGLYSINNAKEHGYEWIPGWMRHRLLRLCPFKLATFISIGSYSKAWEAFPIYYPSVGHIWTNGSEGEKQWDGSLRGKLFEFREDYTNVYYDVYYVGVEYFMGLNFILNGQTRFLGFAREVKIDYW